METHCLLAMLLLFTGGVDHAAATDNSTAVVTPVGPAIIEGTTSEAQITTEITVVTENSQTTDGTTPVSTTVAPTTQPPDNEAPVLNCSDVSAFTDQGKSTAIVTYNPGVTDNVNGTSLSVTCSPTSGSSFNVGSTDVNCFAIDSARNNGTCTFQVTVNDNEAPVLTCPDDSAFTDQGKSTTTVTYNPGVTDNVDADTSLSATCSPSSGSSFNFGSTDVNCFAIDSAGNNGTCTFQVNVTDNEAPVLTCTNVTNNTDPGKPTANVTYNPGVTDNVNGTSLSATCSPSSSSSFNFGSTDVNCFAIDSAGNNGTCTFQVNVTDNEDPVVSCPSDITQPTDPGKNVANVSWPAPAVRDNVDSDLQASCDPASGGPVESGGPLTVACEATDNSGNKGSCMFTITVEDKEKPELNCPKSVQRQTDPGERYATYNVSVTATDNVDIVAPSCVPNTNIFYLNTTNVTCTATDNSANSESCSFVVTVVDDELPTFKNCEDQTFKILLNDDGEAAVNYTKPSVTDNDKVVSGPVCTPDSGSMFSVDSSLVTCNASDASGNIGSCSFNVILIDCVKGTFGQNCMNCTCVDNELCEETTGDCTGCEDQKNYGFECNYRDLHPNITATGLSILDGNVTQHRGEDVELVCKYNLRNIKGYWRRDGIDLVEFTGDTTGMSTYTIPSVNFNDSGTYTCTLVQLVYTDIRTSVSESVFVSVEVPAKFVKTPIDQSSRLEANLTFSCSASGKPKVEIIWVNNDGNHIGEMGTKYNIFETTAEENMIITTSSILVVYDISRSDNGVYECQANNTLINEVPVLVDDFEIFVQEKPDPVIIKEEASQATAKAREITVIWTRGNKRNSEIQNCTVKYKEEDEDVFDSVKAANDESHTLVGLTPFTNYDIEVFCSNNIGRSDKDEVTLKTDEDAPTAPRNVQAEFVDEDNIENDLCRVTWTAPEELNGEIIRYTAKYTVAPVGNEGSIEIDDGLKVLNGDGLMLDIKANLPNSVYAIKVFGTTNANGLESAAAKCTTDAAGPSKIEQPVQPTNPEVNHDSFKITLTEPSSRNGLITCYAVIVVQLKAGDTIDHENPDSEYPDSKLMPYDQAKDQPYVPYVAVAFGKFQKEITIGSGDTSRCQTSGRQRRSVPWPRVGNNGELQSESTYTVFLRAYVSEEVYSSSPLIDPVKTGKNNTAMIVVVAIVVILVLVVIILAAVMAINRRHYLRERLFGSSSGRRQQFDGPLELGSRDNTGYLQEYPAIPVERLQQTFEEKHRDGDKLFNQEYKSLPASSRAITTEASNLAENKGKNRYINILAYDQSRVILEEIDGEPGSDYINACYVDGYQFNNKFIAAQGPKEETVVDFWRMIWEQNSPAIVMLTKTFEKGREKCAQYWPDSGSQEFEQFTITLEDTVKTCEYVIRKFRVQNSDYDNDTRSIQQYHFIGWPDFGIPDYPYTMLSFIKRIRQMVPKPTSNGDIGPLTVHCSAGVGRTGTYIVIDAMLDQMVAEKQVDIYNFVSKIRGQRNLLVQSQVQYVFIHQALMEEYLYNQSEIDVTSMQQKWSDLILKPANSDFTNLELEFRRVTQIPTSHLTQKDGTLEPNKIKNRLLQVIPYNSNRVKLQRLIGKEHSDYINASYIDGYEYKSMYIATQGPTKDTVGDFWRMVWDERTSCIIMMTDLEENGQERCTKYWPDDNTPVVHDTIAVQVKEQREVEGSEYIVREFQVTNTKGGESRSVFQYHYVGWPHSGAPSSGTGLVDLIGKVHKYQESIHSTFPIVVHCSGGAGRTGVFIALSIMLERVKAEGVIDVFQTVRTLRQQRPHMVQTFEQYGFCYHAVREYMDSFDHYANLK